MSEFVFLEYSFMFEPGSTWQHLSQFEQDLAAFFTDNGHEAQVIKTVNGQSGRRILLIKKVENKVVKDDTSKPKRLLPMKQQLDKFRNPK